MGDTSLDDLSKGQSTPISSQSKGYGASARCAYCNTGVPAGIGALRPNFIGSLQLLHVDCVSEYDSQHRWMAMSPEEKQGELEAAIQKVSGIETSLERISDIERSISPAESVSLKRVGKLLLYSLVPFTYAYKLSRIGKQYHLTNPPMSAKNELMDGCGGGFIETCGILLSVPPLVSYLDGMPVDVLSGEGIIVTALYFFARASLIQQTSLSNSRALEKTRDAFTTQLADARKNVQEIKAKIDGEDATLSEDDSSPEERIEDKRVREH